LLSRTLLSRNQFFLYGRAGFPRIDYAHTRTHTCTHAQYCQHHMERYHLGTQCSLISINTPAATVAVQGNTWLLVWNTGDISIRFD